MNEKVKEKIASFKCTLVLKHISTSMVDDLLSEIERLELELTSARSTVDDMSIQLSAAHSEVERLERQNQIYARTIDSRSGEMSAVGLWQEQEAKDKRIAELERELEELRQSAKKVVEDFNKFYQGYKLNELEQALSPNKPPDNPQEGG